MEINKVKYLLSKKGLKFVDIDKQFGLREGVTRFALSKPNPKGEKALSKVLGISLKELFPERYDEQGNRLIPQPAKNYTFKKINESLVSNNA